MSNDQFGMDVIRFTNKEVEIELEVVLNKIRLTCHEKLNSPLGVGGNPNRNE